MKFKVVTEKNYTLTSLSHQSLCALLSWFRWCFQSTLSYFTSHNSFSLPCVILCASPLFLFPSCCCFFLVLFLFIVFLLTAGSYLQEKRPKVRLLLGHPPKSVFFPLLKISPPVFLQIWKWSDETVTALYLQPSQL